MTTFRRDELHVGSCIALMLCTAANPSAASAADADGEALQEIVVTAQHKEENVQSTPIAMSVYTGDAVKQNNIVDIASLAAFAPDVNFSTSEGSAIVTVRGISSLDITENGDPAVAVDIDGFYVNRPYGLNAALYDIDRIEVLRGPQGTLNGRNAVGGAINIITAQPTDKFQAYTSVSYGNYNALTVQGMVNLPLSDVVQLRASFLSDSHDGYRHNAPQPDADDADNKSGRLELAFEPLENFRGLVTVQFTKEGGYGDSLQNIPYLYSATGSLVNTLPPGVNPHTFPLATEPFLNMTDRLTRFNFSYDLGSVLLTALGGYDHMEWHHASDESSTDNVPVVNTFVQNEYPNTFNGELRAASKTDSPLQWQVGTFYFRENSHLVSFNGAPTADGVYDQYFGFVYATRSRSAAGYAQASYQLTSDLKATAGVRYTSDFKGEAGYYGDLTAGPALGDYAYQSGSTSSHRWTYHGALDYTLTDKNLLYLKYDTGYKAGGFNFGGAPYNPETVTSYELGSKNRFFDETLQWNSAVFLTNDNAQQVATYAFLPNGLAEQLTENAGKSKIWGVETDIIYKVPYLGTFNAAVNYLNARYTNFLSVADPSDPTAAGNVQLAGNTPPQSPTLSAQLGLEHSWAAFNGTLTGRIQTKIQSSSNFSFYNFDDTRQAAYTMSDAFLSYGLPSTGSSDAHWKVTAYVKNLENSSVFSTAQEDRYAVAYTYQWFPPRTYGLRLETTW
jgi:iron complex outermembrane receptor protein